MKKVIFGFLSLVCLSSLLNNQILKSNAAENEVPGIGDIIEAEDVIYYSDDGKVETSLYDWHENSTSLRYFSDTESQWVSGSRIANGASNKAAAGLDGNKFVAKMEVFAETAGEYELFIRAQSTTSQNLAGVFNINLNEAKDAEGALEYTPLQEAGTVLVANQNYNAELTGDDAFDFETWNNMRSWSIVSLGKVNLLEGKNVVRLNKNDKAPNIDYFVFKDTTPTEKVNYVYSLRSENIAGNGNETNFTSVNVATNSELGAYSAEADYQIKYTGLYMRIYDFSSRHPWYGAHTVYAEDIAIDEAMISGVDYTVPGTYEATATYKNSQNLEGYTAKFKVVVGEGGTVDPVEGLDEFKLTKTEISLGLDYSVTDNVYAFSNLRLYFRFIFDYSKFTTVDIQEAGVYFELGNAIGAVKEGASKLVDETRDGEFVVELKSPMNEQDIARMFDAQFSFVSYVKYNDQYTMNEVRTLTFKEMLTNYAQDTSYGADVNAIADKALNYYTNL